MLLRTVALLSRVAKKTLPVTLDSCLSLLWSLSSVRFFYFHLLLHQRKKWAPLHILAMIQSESFLVDLETTWKWESLVCSFIRCFSALLTGFFFVFCRHAKCWQIKFIQYFVQSACSCVKLSFLYKWVKRFYLLLIFCFDVFLSSLFLFQLNQILHGLIIISPSLLLLCFFFFFPLSASSFCGLSPMCRMICFFFPCFLACFWFPPSVLRFLMLGSIFCVRLSHLPAVYLLISRYVFLLVIFFLFFARSYLVVFLFLFRWLILLV